MKARAAIQGRTYVIPDDVKTLAESILVHRVVLSTDAELSDRSAREVIADVVASVQPPSAEAAAQGAPAVSDGGAQGEMEETDGGGPGS